jgi:hypothetical protein
MGNLYQGLHETSAHIYGSEATKRMLQLLRPRSQPGLGETRTCAGGIIS